MKARTSRLYLVLIGAAAVAAGQEWGNLHGLVFTRSVVYAQTLPPMIPSDPIPTESTTTPNTPEPNLPPILPALPPSAEPSPAAIDEADEIGRAHV